MGEIAQQISKVDREELLKALNCAFAEEWLSYYQYWLGAKLAEGIERPKIVKEFIEHAKEEIEHADWLAERIIQLGGTPILDPMEWKSKAQCQYEAPTNADTTILVEQNLKGERCAIARYQKICEMCQEKDYDTFQLSRQILDKELQHEQEMEDFKADFKYYKR